jgi:hypothetical protein
MRQNKDNMIKEEVCETAKMVFSTEKPKKEEKIQRESHKYILSIDNLRIVAYSLPKDHEDYTEDTFNVLNFYVRGDLTPYANSVLLELKEMVLPTTKEFRYGYYEAEPVYTKKK